METDQPVYPAPGGAKSNSSCAVIHAQNRLLCDDPAVEAEIARGAAFDI